MLAVSVTQNIKERGQQDSKARIKAVRVKLSGFIAGCVSNGEWTPGQKIMGNLPIGAQKKKSGRRANPSPQILSPVTTSLQGK